MLENLLTEQRNLESEKIDILPTSEVLRIINDEDRKVAESVSAAIPQIALAVDGIVDRFRSSGRLFYIGAGTSGRLGVLDASECPPTYSVPYEMVQGIMAGGEAALSKATEVSEDDPDSGERDIESRGFTSKDTLVGIAASGRTPYVLGAVRAARKIGALTVGIACVPGSELAQAAEIGIELVTGPEVVTGSTRMKAGTATKLALNMITTASMIKLGYVYGNLMVNVQPKNEKLRDRARRIVRDASGVDDETAEKLLTDAGDVRTAIVMAKLGVPRERAAALLKASSGIVRKALEWKNS
ncbi:MAG TPA: N-acetylmuramic acid 6-phosphate etherase [Bryobacteraceae bacterium]|nr:N-acetylmuramic acid 6-phosphate etherase [Bryobacteraceae bacterium]